MTIHAPLSFNQERLWLLSNLDPGNSYYKVPSIVILTGQLYAGALEKSIIYLLKRHDSLRTNFDVDSSGNPVQVVNDFSGFRLEMKQMQNTPAEQINNLLLVEANKPLSLKSDPLFNCFLVQIDHEKYYFYNDFHYIIADGKSQEIFFKELSWLYHCYVNNADPELPDLNRHYAEFCLSQREDANISKLEIQKKYWLNKLSEPREILNLPLDFQRSESCKYKSNYYTKTLSLVLSNKIRHFVKNEQTTFFRFILSVFDILLYRISDQEDQIICFPGSGRKNNEYYNIIGMLENILIHRIKLCYEKTFKEVLSHVIQDIDEALNNEEFPFKKIVEKLNNKYNINQLFQVFINSVTGINDNLSLTNITCKDLTHDFVSKATNFDLELLITPYEQISLDLIYNGNLFTDKRIKIILDQIEYLIEQVTENPYLKIHEYSLVPRYQLSSILPDPKRFLNNNLNKTVIYDFLNQARQFPDKTAIVDTYSKLSYAQLNDSSNRVAEYLHKNNLGVGDIVAIYAEKSAALVCSILGIIKSGAAFLIIDPSYPSSRIIYYFKNTKPRHCIEIEGTNPGKDVKDYISGNMGHTLFPESCKEISHFLKKYKELSFDVSVQAKDRLYAVYTSGSTNFPKCITGVHAPVANFIEWQIQRFNLDKSENVSMLSGLSHDPLLRDIFLPLSLGATLHIPHRELLFHPDDFNDWLLKRRISIIHCTPSMCEMLVNGIKQNNNNLHFIFSGGEMLKRSLTKKIKEKFTHCTIVNFYGATETPQAMGYCIVTNDINSTNVPIGEGIRNSQILVLNRCNKMSGVGELGEIYIRSPHLSNGYLNDSKLTREKFINNFFTKDASDKMYRTGDFGRYLPTGMVEYMGRKDKQVKLRGFRIELGEIETALCRNKEIKRAVVILREDNPGNPVLVAYYEATMKGIVIIPKLKSFMKNILPEYMLPSFYVELEKIPLTPNGKIDRNALPKAEVICNEDLYSRPQTDIECKLTEIFADILKINKVGLYDNFFDLGGNSLLAVQLLQKIKQDMKKEIPLIALFRNPNVSAMAEFCSDRFRCEEKVMEVLNSEGSKTPVFYVGTTLVARKCAEFWEKDRPVYAINIIASDILFDDLDDFSIKKLSIKYADEMIEKNPDRPFYIYSYCLDQIIASEVCFELERRGKRIGLLIFIDFDRFGLRSAFLEGLMKYGFLFLTNKLKIILHKFYYRIRGQIKEIAEYDTRSDRTFYDKYYTPACTEYKPDYSSFPLLMFLSMDWKYTPEPEYILKLKNRMKTVYLPYLHLPSYRKEKALKKIVEISKKQIIDLEVAGNQNNDPYAVLSLIKKIISGQKNIYEK